MRKKEMITELEALQEMTKRKLHLATEAIVTELEMLKKELLKDTGKNRHIKKRIKK